MRKELNEILDAAKSLEREQLPRFLGDLREIEAIALARLAAPILPGPQDDWMDITEAARYMRVGKDFLYSRKQLGKRVGSKLVFSRKTLDRFIEKSR